MVVVEDLDHDAVFGYPACPAVARYLTLYAALVRARGGDPVIGPTSPHCGGRPASRTSS